MVRLQLEFGDERLPVGFWNKVHPEPLSGCWIWEGSMQKRGYALVFRNNKTLFGHKEVAKLIFPEFVDELHRPKHSCGVRACVNPEHIYLVRRDECGKGHKFTPENTRVYNGKRQCIKCANDRRPPKRKAGDKRPARGRTKAVAQQKAITADRVKNLSVFGDGPPQEGWKPGSWRK